MDGEADQPEDVALLQVFHSSNDEAGIHRDQPRVLALGPRPASIGIVGRLVEPPEGVGHVPEDGANAISVLGDRPTDLQHSSGLLGVRSDYLSDDSGVRAIAMGWYTSPPVSFCGPVDMNPRCRYASRAFGLELAVTCVGTGSSCRHQSNGVRNHHPPDSPSLVATPNEEERGVGVGLHLEHANEVVFYRSRQDQVSLP